MSTETQEETAKIVVAERDQATLELLCEHLTAEHFNTLTASTVEEARKLIESARPDLVLLDLAMGNQMVELVREIRDPERQDETGDPPVAMIVLSRRDSERDRVKCLAEGADDYLNRPFSFGELLARINSVLRRRKSSGPITKAGDIEIDHLECKAAVAGRTVRLSAKEFLLLKTLATEPRRVFSKEELLQEVWGYQAAGHSRTLEAHCSRLRRKLDPDGGQYVVQCWGVGYRLLAP